MGVNAYDMPAKDSPRAPTYRSEYLRPTGTQTRAARLRL